ncbi:hypothetical protein HYT57_01135 [Candidatus Woesearchaeota archaeon]|nr:hypothetical protein [Candidatus Woesearchaeota archaeon]
MQKKRVEVLTYPKLAILIATYILAYIIFSDNLNTQFHNFLIPLGYIGIFIAGILYTFGFTSAIATAILLILAGDQNIFLAAIIGGIGAMIGDLTIFKFIRHSVDDEFKNLTKEKVVIYLTSKVPKKIKKHLVVILGYIILSSPLPDEIGVSLLASYTKISEKMFAVVSYITNTIGILIILVIGNSL